MTFTAHEELDTEPPILNGPHENIGGPHLLSPEVATALPALWYSLHLPRDVFDTLDLSASVLKFVGEVGDPVQVLFLPLAWLNESILEAGPYKAFDRMRIYCADADIEDAAQRSTDLGFRLPPIPHSAMDDDQLQRDWTALREHWAEQGAFSDALVLEGRLKLRPMVGSQVICLAMDRVARQMGHIGEAHGSMDVHSALKLRALVNTAGRLEQSGVAREEAEMVFERELMETYHTQRLPVSAVLPGMPRAYSNTVSGTARTEATVPVLESATDDVEASAMAVIAAGSGVQHEALALVLPQVPNQAWVLLAELERHWALAARPPVVRKMLDRLDLATLSVWNEELVAALKAASVLRVATNFPIGLLRLPGDSAPLSFRLPISYEPLTPLTRRLQGAFAPLSDVDLTRGFKVLVVECISNADPVGFLSRQGWDAAEAIFEEANLASATLHRREAQCVADLRDALSDVQPDIAVISAHGLSQPAANAAGVLVGNEFFLGLGLDYIPPAVLLSACHVSPRGVGQVSIVDMLLQQGALAVLGTQVPVDVRHNATLMARLFVYVGEALARAEPEATLLEVWHRTVGGNPIVDVLQGNRQLAEWSRRPFRDGVVLTEFMSNYSVRRLRKQHVYADTEEVLTEMASEMGVAERVRNWLRAPGYLPESAMYSFYGHPDRIRLAPHPTL